MSQALVRGVRSIVMTSKTPEVTAAFYRDILGVPLGEEQHENTSRHFAGKFGDLHIAVLPREGFWRGSGQPEAPLVPAPADGSAPAILVSFTIEDLDAFVAHLARHQVEVVGWRDMGPTKIVTIRDPDGRLVGCGTPWTEPQSP